MAMMATAALAGCAEDEIRAKVECTVEETVASEDAFDVDQVSEFTMAYNLKDAPGVDAVIIPGRPSSLEDDDKWSVSTVSIMIVVPSDAPDFGKGGKIGVRLWDGTAFNKSSTKFWEVTKTFDPDDLKWSTAKGSHDVNRSDCYNDDECDSGYSCASDWGLCRKTTTVKTAYLEFDLGAKIGSAGLKSSKIAVGVVWPRGSSVYPLVGASDFDRPCKDNWTDFGDGTYQQTGGSQCTWPMVKVKTTEARKVVTQTTDCD